MPRGWSPARREAFVFGIALALARPYLRWEAFCDEPRGAYTNPRAMRDDNADAIIAIVVETAAGCAIGVGWTPSM